MSETSTATSTAADFAPELRFLLDHPNLPTPRGVDFMSSGGILAILHTAGEVAQWAQVISAEVHTTERKGNTHHSVYTFDPFYISATAIVAPEQVQS